MIQRILRDWSTYRGRAVEPLVRHAMERRLPDPDLGEARVVGAYWERTGAIEVDLVGAEDTDATRVDFVGSIKWRTSRQFSNNDLAALVRQRGAVPGTDAGTLLVVVTRTGAAVPGVDVTFGPELLLEPA